MRNTNVANLYNIIKQVMSVAFEEVDYVELIAHKHSECASNSRFIVELPQVRCAGLTHTTGDLDSLCPTHIVISSIQRPRRIS